MQRFFVGLLSGLAIGLVSITHAAASDEAKREESEKLFTEFAEYVTEGVWKTTVPLGNVDAGKWKPIGGTQERTEEFRWIAGKKYLQVFSSFDGKPSDIVMILGIDQESNELKWWRFAQRGEQNIPFAKEKDGIWSSQGTYTEPGGVKTDWKFVTRMVSRDERRVELTIARDGMPVAKEDVAPPAVWKRHSK